MGASNSSTEGYRRAGGQGHLGASWAQERSGQLAARGFILPEGKVPPRVARVSEGLGFGKSPLLPPWKGQESPGRASASPRVALLS